jgi:hypothetical protein
MAGPKQYTTVSEMLRDVWNGDDTLDTFCDELDEKIASRRLVKRLIVRRAVLGLTQSDLGRLVGQTQAWVCRLEFSDDNSVSLGDFKLYAKAVGYALTVELREMAGE